MNFDEFKWTLAEGEYNGKHVLLRFRQFPRDFKKTTYPIRLNIFWRVSEASALRLPLQAESVRLEEFEDYIVEAIEPDQHSILSLVLTGDSHREFVFHTRDDEAFLERLSAIPQKANPYPIEICRFQDPHWKYDEGVTSTVNVQDAQGLLIDPVRLPP